MKKSALLAGALLCLTQCGCMTMMTVESAKGRSYKNEKGEKVVTDEPKPASYLLVPFAVAGDTITLPFQLFTVFLLSISGIKC
jgi:hypothetical protein